MLDQVKEAFRGPLQTSVDGGEGVQSRNAGRRILVGPSYMREIESIDWKSATVRFLRKEKSATDDTTCGIYYDLASMKEVIAGFLLDAPARGIKVSLRGLDISAATPGGGH